MWKPGVRSRSDTVRRLDLLAPLGTYNQRAPRREMQYGRAYPLGVQLT